MVCEEMEKKGIKVIFNDIFFEIEKKVDGLFVGYIKGGNVLVVD